MGKLPLTLGAALLSLGACTSGEYGYATSAEGYAPDYTPRYAPAYGYGYGEPSYSPPPFWGSGLQLEFGGGRRHHRREGGDWDRGD